MTTLLYRGQAYEQAASVHSQQLRYDRGVYGARQDAARTSRTLTYRGCGYSSSKGVADQKSGNFRYRGVSYSL